MASSRGKQRRIVVPAPIPTDTRVGVCFILTRLPTAVAVVTFRYLDQIDRSSAMQTCHTLCAIGLQPASCAQLRVAEISGSIPPHAMWNLRTRLAHLETLALGFCNKLAAPTEILAAFVSESRPPRPNFRLKFSVTKVTNVVATEHDGKRLTPWIERVTSVRTRYIQVNSHEMKQPLALFGCVLPGTLERLSIHYSMVGSERMMQIATQFPKLRALSLDLYPSTLPALAPICGSLVQVRFSVYRSVDDNSADEKQWTAYKAICSKLTCCTRAHLSSDTVGWAFTLGCVMPALQRLVVEDYSGPHRCNSRILRGLRVTSPVLGELVLKSMKLTSDMFEALVAAFGAKQSALHTLEFRSCIVSHPCNWLLLDPLASLRRVYFVGMFVDRFEQAGIKRVLSRASVAYVEKKSSK